MQIEGFSGRMRRNARSGWSRYRHQGHAEPEGQRHITKEDATQTRLPRSISSYIPRVQPTKDATPATRAAQDAHTGVRPTYGCPTKSSDRRTIPLDLPFSLRQSGRGVPVRRHQLVRRALFRRKRSREDVWCQRCDRSSCQPRGLFDNVEAELSVVLRAERQVIGVDRHRKGGTERRHTTDPGIQIRNLAQLPGLDVDEIDVGEADTSELERPMAHGLPAATRWFLADRAR